MFFDEALLTLLHSYQRLVVGYSGGLDSTVLLHALLDQGLADKILAVHINHGLSPNALHWENHCQQMCSLLNVSFLHKRLHLRPNANIEDLARKARFAVFKQLILPGDCLLFAHHLNDQAETLLLHLLRGTGIDGLAGMPQLKPFGQGHLLRPLLHHTRETLKTYAKAKQLNWVEDESNSNCQFSRNYLRHQILPLIQSRWPKAAHNFLRSSLHCQQAKANLEDLATLDYPDLHSSQLVLSPLKSLSLARLTNVLRSWLKENHVSLPTNLTFNRLISDLIKAKPDAKPIVAWGEIAIRRFADVLYLLKKDSPEVFSDLHWPSFPNPLLIAGLGILHAKQSKSGLMIPEGSLIEVCFRKGGEVFRWHQQSKQLKTLLQEWQVPPWLRNSIPLLYINKQLAAVVGYAISDNYWSQTDVNQRCYGLQLLTLDSTTGLSKK